MGHVRPFLICAVMVLSACGLTKSQTDTFLDLNKAMASEYSDISMSFYSWADAVEKASPDGSVAKAKATETKLYIVQKDQKFATLVNDLARAIIASKELDPAQKQALIDDFFKIVDALKKGGA